MIKELHQNPTLTSEIERDCGVGAYRSRPCSPTLDVVLNSALLSEYLINSLGIEPAFA